MAGTTSPDNIPYMTTLDGVIDTAFTEALADGIQDAFNTRAIHQYRWPNSAARTAQTGMQTGDTGYQVDTGARYRYTGSAWVVDTNGLILLSTTSFSGVSSQSVNSVFTSTFANYRVVLDIPTVGGANVITFRLRVGGADSATLYGYQILQGSGATTTSLQSGATTSWSLTGSATRHSASTDIYGPAAVASTQSLAEWVSSTSTTSQSAGKIGGYHSAATAYDGFTLITSASTMTGTVKVYGYA